MNMRKKVAFFIAALSFSSVFLSALDWGGLIDDTSKISYANKSPSIFQSNGIYLWLKSPLNSDGNIIFSSEILYKYNLNIDGLNKNPNSTFTNIVDVDLLKIEGSWDALNGGIFLNAGRFFTADISSVVFSQISDGVQFGFKNKTLAATLYAGYTGLLNSLNVSMTESNPNSNYKQIYNLAAPFVPLSAEFSLLNVFGFSATLQVDYFLSILKDIQSRAYASLNLSGNLSTVGALNFNFVVGTYKFDSLMMFSNLNLTFFLGNYLILGGGAEYASGEKSGKIAAFSPVTSRSVYSGFRPLENLSYISPNLGVTFVYDKLYAKLTEKTVFSFADEATVFGLDSALDVKYNIFTDLQLGCSGTLYFDFSNSKYNNYSLTLSAALEF